MRHTTPLSHKALEAKVSADVQAWIEAGNEPEQIPFGVSRHTEGLTYSHYDERNREIKRQKALKKLNGGRGRE